MPRRSRGRDDFQGKGVVVGSQVSDRLKNSALNIEQQIRNMQAKANAKR